MEHLTGTIGGLLIRQNFFSVLKLKHGILNFAFFSLQLKTADHRYSMSLNQSAIRPQSPFHRLIESLSGPISNSFLISLSLEFFNPVISHIKRVISFCPALVTLNDANIKMSINTLTDHPYKLKKGLHIAILSVMLPEQIKYVKPIAPASIWHLSI